MTLKRLKNWLPFELFLVFLEFVFRGSKLSETWILLTFSEDIERAPCRMFTPENIRIRIRIEDVWIITSRKLPLVLINFFSFCFFSSKIFALTNSTKFLIKIFEWYQKLKVTLWNNCVVTYTIDHSRREWSCYERTTNRRYLFYSLQWLW